MSKGYKKAEGYVKLYLSGELEKQLEERKLELLHPPKKGSQKDLRKEQPDPKVDTLGYHNKLEQDVLKYVDDGSYVFLKNYISIIKTHLRYILENDCITYTILIRFYKNNEKWAKIAKDLHLSESSCKRRRKEALEKMEEDL